MFGEDQAIACSAFQAENDEVILERKNSKLVLNSAASIQKATIVKNKDIRNVLDVISDKGTVQQAD